MQNIKKYIGIIVLVLMVSFAYSQTPPPPNNGGSSPGGGNTPVGGGAPVGGGVLILLSAAAAYGYMQYRKNLKYTISEEIE